jgi:outer membrane protease
MNHTAKSIAPIVFLVIIFFCGALPGTAETALFGENYGFSVTGGAGILYGTSYEIVYLQEGKNDYLSELQWEIKPLIYLGIKIDYTLKNPADMSGFFFSFGFKAAVPMKTGIMEDRDWDSFSYPVDPGTLTNFSSHENRTINAFLISFDTAFSIPVRKLVIKYFLNVDFMFYKWEAWNGFFQYMNYNFEKKPIDGLCISYRQYWFLFNTGVKADLFLDYFSFSAGIFFGPSFCIAIDDHHSRNIKFIDSLYIGLMVRPELGFSFNVSRQCTVGLFASYHYTTETRGNTMQKNNGIVSGITKGSAGAAFRAFEGAVTVKYFFYRKIIS